MSNDTKTTILELLCLVAAVAFCVIVWWPAALAVLSLAFGYAAFNQYRKGQR